MPAAATAPERSLPSLTAFAATEEIGSSFNWTRLSDTLVGVRWIPPKEISSPVEMGASADTSPFPKRRATSSITETPEALLFAASTNGANFSMRANASCKAAGIAQIIASAAKTIDTAPSIEEKERMSTSNAAITVPPKEA